MYSISDQEVHLYGSIYARSKRMRAHHNIENKQENQPGVVPPMYGQETKQGEAVPQWQPPPPPFPRPPNRLWLTVILVTVVVVLLAAVSVGIIALVRSGQQRLAAGTPTPIPATTPHPTPTTLPTRQWMQVLAGYHVTEILAAPSDPTVLYACAIAPGVPIENQSVQTILRSADSGATWQNIGKRAQMSRSCELAVNPTDSYEIYVATSSNPPTEQAVSSYILEHTSNGGDSWEAIHPTVNVPGLNVTLPWQGTHLRFAGNRLYSVQALPLSSAPTSQGLRGWHPTALARLLTSKDGGHTWQILDTQLAATGRWAEAYVVNLAYPALFYELTYVPTEPGTAFPSFELSRSVDGGRTWQLVEQHLPWLAPLLPATILTSSENPNVMYLTNTRCPVAQAFRADNWFPTRPSAGSPFSMCTSRDAGKTWKTLQAPGPLAQVMSGGVVDQQGRLYTQATTSGLVEIWCYDPVADMWSQVAQAPRAGNVLAETPTGTAGTTALWLMSTSDQKALYRYII